MSYSPPTEPIDTSLYVKVEDGVLRGKGQKNREREREREEWDYRERKLRGVVFNLGAGYGVKVATWHSYFSFFSQHFFFF